MLKPIVSGGAFGALVALLLSGCASHPHPTSSAGGPPAATPSGAPATGFYRVGAPYEIDGIWYYPAVNDNYDEIGIASWYGPNFDGKFTANGEVYNMNDVTAAHKTLPLPSIVHVTNLDNGRDIVVRINDRGPFVEGRIIDLSRRSAQLIGMLGPGTAKVRVQIMPEESHQAALLAMKGQTPSAETLMAGMSSAPGSTASASSAAAVATAPLPPIAPVGVASLPAAGFQPANMVVATDAPSPVSSPIDAAAAAPRLQPVTAVALPPPPGLTPAAAPIASAAPPAAASAPPVQLIAPATAAVPPASAPAAPRKQAPTAVAALPPQLPPAKAVPMVARAPASATAASLPSGPPAPHMSPAPAAPILSPARIASAAPASGNGLFIQVGAFSQFTNANRLCARLSVLAPARVSQATVNGQPFFRVFVGPAANVVVAGKLLDSVLHAGYSDARIVTE